ncbi:MAG: type III pantothenate kinase [Campylobacter sp.]|nr:type III pantothenate kinase [Campylobacter sp.]
MILCDIGNSQIKLYEDGKISSFGVDKFANFKPKKRVYFISVNPKISPTAFNFINIKDFFCFATKYRGLGIDRIAGCYDIKDGVVVDAGTAITVDIMSEGIHQGGYIYPGIYEALKNYALISDALKVSFNSNIDLDILPQKTNDALTYGLVKPLVLSIKDIAKDQKIYLTGGDGHFFSQFFKNSVFDKTLIFRGMLKALKQKGVIC